MPRHILPTIIAASLLVSACDSPEPLTQVKAAEKAEKPEGRWYSYDQVRSGGKIYANNCAECHGRFGEGAKNWRQIGEDGKFPPPPLNGTGHAWHHPTQMLFHVIKSGSPGGQGNMPPWGDKLSDEQITATIAWFQSRWPEEVYQAWQRRENQILTGS